MSIRDEQGNQVSQVEFNEATTHRRALLPCPLTATFNQHERKDTIVDFTAYSTPLSRSSVSRAHARIHSREHAPKRSHRRGLGETKSRESLKNPLVHGLSNRINPRVTQRSITGVPKCSTPQARLGPLRGAVYRGKHEYSGARKGSRRAHLSPIFARFFFLCC